MKTIGNRIADLRNEKRMTQSELAELLHISDKAVSKWENTDSCPDISLLPALSDIFEVSIDYLVRGEAFKPQKIFFGSPYDNRNKINECNLVDGLNKYYLQRGWHIVSTQLDCTEDYCAVFVIEKES